MSIDVNKVKTCKIRLFRTFTSQKFRMYISREKKMKDTIHIELDKQVMQKIRHNCRRDQRVSEYILDLILFRESHDHNE